MKSNENPIFISKAKKIDLIKNISVNLKCLKSQKIKLSNKINQNLNKKLDPNYIINSKISKKNNINNNTEKYINIINIEKIPNPSKVNHKRSKSTKSFSVNNSNKSNIKRNLIIKRNTKHLIKNKNHIIKTTNNTNNKKSEFFKKINISKNCSNNKIRKNTINKISPISRPKKIIQNNAEITPNNPMELTFGSSSFMSNNLQTETNETDKAKISSIQANNRKNKNYSFIRAIKAKEELKSIKNSNIGKIKPNKIVKLNKKLLLKPSWKIKPSQIMYKPLKPYNNKEKEKLKSKDDKNNKSVFIIENYNKKAKYNNNKVNNLDKNFYNINNITDIKSSKSFIKDNKTINKNKNKIFNYYGKNIKTGYSTFYNKNLLRNKLFKLKNEKSLKHSWDTNKIVIKNYSLNNSSYYKINIINNNKQKVELERDNINETKDCIIKINKSVDKEKGKYKLIIKRTNKVIKRIPKSTPKLLLTHPSFKNLFF